MNIADIYFSEEKFDKAITYYELAMQNKDLYWNCYYKLAKFSARPLCGVADVKIRLSQCSESI